MPADGVTAEQIEAQVAAEVAYHAADACGKSSAHSVSHPNCRNADAGAGLMLQ